MKFEDFSAMGMSDYLPVAGTALLSAFALWNGWMWASGFACGVGLCVLLYTLAVPKIIKL